jgi:hypothetical protein
MKDGFTVDYYIHPDTWLIERRRDYKALHPDVDPTKKAFETKFSDFRKDGGVIRAYKAEEYEVESGAWAQRTTLQKIEINKEFPPSIFEKP